MSKDFQFLLISPNDGDAQTIKTAFGCTGPFTVTHVISPVLAFEMVKRLKPDGVLYNIDHYNVMKLKLITDLREAGYKNPVILFASTVEEAAVVRLPNIDKLTTLIQKPIQLKEIVGLLKKILKGETPTQQVHRRFNVKQSGVLERPLTGETLSGKIHNMSRSGFYMEVDAGKIKRGDIFRLTISLDNINSTRTVNAEAVWSTPEGYVNQQPAAGFRFISDQDVYRKMLEQF